MSTPKSTAAPTCPLCGSALEWRIHGVEGCEFPTGSAYCVWSGYAYLEGADWDAHEAGKVCPWTGTVQRIGYNGPVVIIRTRTGEGPHLPAGGL
jgi:hypothetical protein